MGVHPNRRRGEIAATFDGETRLLCLTLGALAELESAFGVGNLAELAGRFEAGRLSAGDIIRVLGAGLRGAGNAFSDEDVAVMSVEGGAAGFARIATELLWVSFGGALEISSSPDREDRATPAGRPENPPGPQAEAW
ncbi:MAG: gene transfer agent family protein [Hoeflea sp.]|uniref:gene transfer agent family protein n=1 Tax=Hoeflea sp. TaxID=1940281 RepID=UPI00272EEED8|nr:gene transfer agent family protein [Hoeflea sp.]MDP2121740.1 gene transfer agent family protein [Hoeflea sp.]